MRYSIAGINVHKLWTDLNRSHQQGIRAEARPMIRSTEVPAAKTDASVELTSPFASMVQVHVLTSLVTPAAW